MPAQPEWSNEMFRCLPKAALAELQSAAREVQLARGDFLFREGEPAQALWLILSGWVRLTRKTAQGQTLTLDIVTPQKSLCGLSAFIGECAYMSTAVAASHVKAIRLPARSLRPLVDAHAELASRLAGLLNERYHQMARAYTQAFEPAQQRIASVLSRLHEAFGDLLPVTRREIAEMAGTTVETAIRVTSRMRQENLVRMKRGQVALLNSRALARRPGSGFYRVHSGESQEAAG